MVLRANGMRSEYLGKFRSILGTVSAVKHAQELESTVVNMFEIEKGSMPSALARDNWRSAGHVDGPGPTGLVLVMTHKMDFAQSDQPDCLCRCLIA